MENILSDLIGHWMYYYIIYILVVLVCSCSIWCGMWLYFIQFFIRPRYFPQRVPSCFVKSQPTQKFRCVICPGSSFWLRALASSAFVRIFQNLKLGVENILYISFYFAFDNRQKSSESARVPTHWSFCVGLIIWQKVLVVVVGLVVCFT